MGVPESGPGGYVMTGDAIVAVTAHRIVNVDGSLAENLGFQHAGANERCVGVALEGRAVGVEDLPVQIGGFSFVEADAAAAIAAGDPLQSNALGQAVLATGVGQHNLIGLATEPLAAGIAQIRIFQLPQQITI